MISVLQRPGVRGRLHPSTIRRRARRLLEQLDEGAADLVIVLTDDLEIRSLNDTWRARDQATDVLSFPQRGDELPPPPPGVVWPLGDVVISLETAARQADQDGCLPRLWACLGVDAAPQWSLLDEATFLLVHGVLHLLGHDHHAPDETARMHAEESRLLPGLVRRRRGDSSGA